MKISLVFLVFVDRDGSVTGCVFSSNICELCAFVDLLDCTVMRWRTLVRLVPCRVLRLVQPPNLCIHQWNRAWDEQHDDSSPMPLAIVHVPCIRCPSYCIAARNMRKQSCWFHSRWNYEASVINRINFGNAKINFPRCWPQHTARSRNVFTLRLWPHWLYLLPIDACDCFRHCIALTSMPSSWLFRQQRGNLLNVIWIHKIVTFHIRKISPRCFQNFAFFSIYRQFHF